MREVEQPSVADSEAQIDNKAKTEAVIAKVSWRLIPFMLLLYIIAYLDRINVSFAGLQMNRDLHFNEEIFGAGAGAFFIGYFLFGVPSNVMVAKLGARRWVSIIMVIWGLLSVSMSMVSEANWFYITRFLLGVAEAGFFPGMILYLTYWFPKKDHAKAVARFMTAIPVAGVLGGLISSRVLLMHGVMGLPGWKWLFIITGAPAVILGFVVLFVLCDGPSQCKWLNDTERRLLLDRIASDNQVALKESSHENIFTNLRVWQLAFLYFCLALGMYGFQLWLPQIIQSFDNQDDSTAALLSAIPAVFQAAGMVVVANHSDAKAERRFHVAVPAFIAATGLILTGICHHPALSLACLCLTAFGIWGTVGPFWAIPTSYLSPSAAAAGIGLINSVGNLGGFAGPYIVGFIKSRAPSFLYSLIALALSLLLAGCLALSIKHQKKTAEP